MEKLNKDELLFRLNSMIKTFNEFKQEMFLMINGFNPTHFETEEELYYRIKELSELLNVELEIHSEEQFEEQGKFLGFKLKINIK